MPIYPTENGRHQAVYENKPRGIKRTRRTFDTKKEAKQWLSACADAAHRRFIGGKPERIFGEALAKYLSQYSTRKKTHTDDLSNAKALRWPIHHNGRWERIDTIALSSDELLPFISDLTHEWNGVLGQRQMHGEKYHLRATQGGGQGWFHQPADRPRTQVTDEPLITLLNQLPHRPISQDTIRIRLALVKRVLTVCYKNMRWIDHNFGDKIEMPKNLEGRTVIITPEEFSRLIEVADDVHADLYRAIIEIGWRLKKIVTLQWKQVHFPVRAAESDSIIQPGYLVALSETDNKKVPPMPMNHQVEALLRRRWELRIPTAASESGYVFHRGQGQPFVSFHKQWQKDIAAAQITSGITRHGLRHTWATNFIRQGGTAPELQALTGWTLATCQKYVHLSGAHIASRYLEISNKRGLDYELNEKDSRISSQPAKRH